MRIPMPLSPRRLVFWMTAFTATGTWLALPNPPPSRPPALESAPWIPLPASGMDASRPTIRGLLSTSFPDIDDFAWRCGHRDDGVSERYLLTDMRDPWEPTSSVEFVPAGASIVVVIRKSVPLPPIEAVAACADRDRAEQASFSRRYLSRQSLAPVRMLWDTQVLWHGEQEIFGCSHGGMTILQACVRGRYAIRVRDCGPQISSARSALRNAVASVLPEVAQPPAKAR